MNSDFTEQEIREFEDQWQVPVLRIANVTGQRTADGRGLDGRSGITVSQISVKPLKPEFKILILICCPYSFPTEVVGRS